MAVTQLFINTNAGSIGQALVRSVTDNTPVSFPQLVIGDQRTFELYFVNGLGDYVSWSGNASYIPSMAIGQCGYPTGGTFTLTFGANTTSALAYNASMAAIQTAFQALGSVGANNATVAGVPGQYFTITFTGALGGVTQAAITTNFSSLTPASNILFTTIVAGGSGVNCVQMAVMALNPISYNGSLSPITNGWSGNLSAATLAVIQAFATAGGTITDTFQVTVVDPSGVSTTYVKQDASIQCTIINPSAYAGNSYPQLVTQAQLSAAVLGLNNFTREALASSAAGNTNVTPASTSRHHTAIATITGAAGTRTFSVLTTASPNAGDTVLITFNTPATAGIVLEVHNATSGGTLLSTVTTDGTAEPYFVLLGYSGSAWQLEFASSRLLSNTGNLAGLASAITSRANLKTIFSAIAAQSASFSVTASAPNQDGTFFQVSAAGGAVVATLPSAVTAGAGFLVALQKIEASTQVVTTSPATATLSVIGQSMVLLSDGTNWNVVMQFNPVANSPTVQGTVQNFYTITGLTGGGTNLDGVATANGAQPSYSCAVIAYGSPPAAQMWRLTPGTDAAVANLVVRPADYDGSTNPQVWKRIL